MKNQEATILRVRTVVAFGETETIMTGKGNVEGLWGIWWRSSSPPRWQLMGIYFIVTHYATHLLGPHFSKYVFRMFFKVIKERFTNNSLLIVNIVTTLLLSLHCLLFFSHSICVNFLMTTRSSISCSFSHKG